jgi:GH15 family glucan-1,4-alpha-glucosidase
VLVSVDERQTIRDLFYPRVGFPNHLNGYKLRTGIWANGRFAWIDDDGWDRAASYEPGTLVATATLTHSELGLEVEIRETVSPHHDRYVRAMTLRNLTSELVDLRVFFNQDLRLNESDIGDTALYNPFLDAMVHYKHATYLAFGSNLPIYEYTTGFKGFNGFEGTSGDAYDGRLDMKPIEQGAVDSTFSVRVEVEPHGSTRADYWVAFGADLGQVSAEIEGLRREGIDANLGESAAYWAKWSAQSVTRLQGATPSAPSQPGDRGQSWTLEPELVDLFRQSTLIMRTHMDDDGAVLAATDSDIMKTNRATYCYTWPRDGSFVALVFARCGFEQPSRRFFEFCRRALDPSRPILAHKYNPDGTVGASWHPMVVDGQPDMPFQEDESALTIHALWEHFQIHHDVEFIGGLYDPFVIPMCDFMLDYRDPKTGLPLPSWDLWEERRGVHTFTVAALVSAFRSASRLADAVGNTHGRRYREAADELAAALVERMFDSSRGVFFRRLIPITGGYEPDTTVDASVLAVPMLHALPLDHPSIAASVACVEQCLSVRSTIGGVARYEGDYYFRQNDAYPGNPWIICTLWLAHCQILLAQDAEDLDTPLRWLRWTAARAAPSGALPEQVHPDTGAPLSVMPLTWSHAEYVNTCLEWVQRRKGLPATAALPGLSSNLQRPE